MYRCLRRKNIMVCASERVVLRCLCVAMSNRRDGSRDVGSGLSTSINRHRGSVPRRWRMLFLCIHPPFLQSNIFCSLPISYSVLLNERWGIPTLRPKLGNSRPVPRRPGCLDTVMNALSRSLLRPPFRERLLHGLFVGSVQTNERCGTHTDGATVKQCTHLTSFLQNV